MDDFLIEEYDSDGEKPLYEVMVRIFVLENRSREWVSIGQDALPLRIYRDTTRRCYRLLSVNGHKPVINMAITEHCSLLKGSSTFAQLQDVRSVLVYGLGFSNEKTLYSFTEQFRCLQSDSASVLASHTSPPPPLASTLISDNVPSTDNTTNHRFRNINSPLPKHNANNDVIELLPASAARFAGSARLAPVSSVLTPDMVVAASSSPRLTVVTSAATVTSSTRFVPTVTYSPQSTSASPSPLATRRTPSVQVRQPARPPDDDDMQNLGAQTSTSSQAIVSRVEMHDSLSGQNRSHQQQSSTSSTNDDAIGSKKALQSLRVENVRLKIALAQSATNARKWEEQMAMLKGQNDRLSRALTHARVALPHGNAAAVAVPQTSSPCMSDSLTPKALSPSVDATGQHSASAECALVKGKLEEINSLLAEYEECKFHDQSEVSEEHVTTATTSSGVFDQSEGGSEPIHKLKVLIENYRKSQNALSKMTTQSTDSSMNGHQSGIHGEDLRAVLHLNESISTKLIELTSLCEELTELLKKHVSTKV